MSVPLVEYLNTCLVFTLLVPRYRTVLYRCLNIYFIVVLSCCSLYFYCWCTGQCTGTAVCLCPSALKLPGVWLPAATPPSPG